MRTKTGRGGRARVGDRRLEFGHFEQGSVGLGMLKLESSGGGSDLDWVGSVGLSGRELVGLVGQLPAQERHQVHAREPFSPAMPFGQGFLGSSTRSGGALCRGPRGCWAPSSTRAPGRGTGAPPSGHSGVCLPLLARISHGDRAPWEQHHTIAVQTRAQHHGCGRSPKAGGGREA